MVEHAESHAQKTTGARDRHIVAPLLRQEPNVARRVAAHHAEYNHLQPQASTARVCVAVQQRHMSLQVTCHSNLLLPALEPVHR